jgi:hypothetical protein
MPVRESLTPPGLDPVVADTRVLRFQVLVGEASLLDFVEAELGGGILDLGEVLVRVRSGRLRPSFSYQYPIDSSIEADIPPIKPEGGPSARP